MRVIGTVLLAGCVLLGACVTPVSVTPPPEHVRVEQTRQMVSHVRASAGDGDWLVVRGYKPTDDLVAAATNAPISHVGIYDEQRDSVIEAEAKGVQATPLWDFVHNSHRLLVIRPIWSAGGAGAVAVEHARKLVGKDYDYLGTIGLGSADDYYCSELAVHVYKHVHEGRPGTLRVIEPGAMYLWGEIKYDSRPRKPQ